MLEGQSDVLAVLVSSTTTETLTSYVTLTETGQTTKYETFTQLSSVKTMTETTYTTYWPVTVMGRITTTARSPITVVAGTTFSSCISQCVPRSTTTICGTVCDPRSTARMTVTRYVTQTGYVGVYSRITVVSTVTGQYATDMPTTMFSTSASTSTYATGQVVSLTATQTFTSVSEKAEPSASDALSQNWSAILVLGAIALAILAFSLGRRSRSRRVSEAVQGPKLGVVYCMSCGAQNLVGSEFCGKCGTKLQV
jgi:ribosomal protein L40E